MGIKILAVLFALLTLRRLVARYRKGDLLTFDFVVWLLLFSGIGVVVFIPHKTDALARWIGVSSGFNALTFVSITGLLFAVFRLVLRLQALERDVTRLVRANALANPIRMQREDGTAA
jgi:hypothetical protein